MARRLSWTLVKLLQKELSLVVAGRSARNRGVSAQLERVRGSIGQELRRLSQNPQLTTAHSGGDTSRGA